LQGSKGPTEVTKAEAKATTTMGFPSYCPWKVLAAEQFLAQQM